MRVKKFSLAITIQATDELKESESSNNNLPLQLPTPESTPVPERTTPTPSREVFGDVGDPRNIVSGPRRRRPSSRRHEAHITDLATPGDFPGFNAAFSAALLQPEKFHRDQLPSGPRNWREMKNHPHQKGILEAAYREIQALTQKNTFKHVERPERTHIIPLTWVYRYKFDTDGFLTKYKSTSTVILQPMLLGRTQIYYTYIGM